MRLAAGARAVSARAGMAILLGAGSNASHPARPSHQMPSPRNVFAGTTVDELE